VGQRVLTRLGYLYRNSYEGAYRVKAKYGGKLFEEKVDHFTGRRSIYALREGQRLIIRLYNTGELDMLQGAPKLLQARTAV
jgi:hypothetical protein